MDDIYRHITMSPPSSNRSLISSTLQKNQFIRRQDKNDENEYEEGDVTGYAMQHPGLMVSKFVDSVEHTWKLTQKLQNTNDGLASAINPLMDNVHNHHSPVNHIAGNKIGKFDSMLPFYLFVWFSIYTRHFCVNVPAIQLFHWLAISSV